MARHDFYSSRVQRLEAQKSEELIFVVKGKVAEDGRGPGSLSTGGSVAIVLAGSPGLALRVHGDRNELLGDTLVQTSVGARKVELVFPERATGGLPPATVARRTPVPDRLAVWRTRGAPAQSDR
ncbi:hypothetical protein QAD02_014332 [Eretmocerus hayati]|uniref:Uncharacterized protein n=1 Tax=Eretmocerus hayati TaxID=131215 RepID=A0ACC2P581_9HYME|nr:hypothetical protein QAD02_014332 [Eretmocerus hayati]